MDAETYTGSKSKYTEIISETDYIALTETNSVPLTQAQIGLCAKIGYKKYCEYPHLLNKRTEHTCMSAIYYDQDNAIKAEKCKTIVTFDYIPQSKILDASKILLLSNLPKPWTIVCKDVDHVFELEYLTYHVLNRSELCECSLTAGNYLLSQTATNCRDVREDKDSLFTTYYTFNKIVLDVLTEKFHILVEEETVTQSAFLHNDIPGYDLPTLDFLTPPEEPKENQILQKDDSKIYTHLENVLVHMIDEQNSQIFKSKCNYAGIFEIC